MPKAPTLPPSPPGAPRHQSSTVFHIVIPLDPHTCCGVDTTNSVVDEEREAQGDGEPSQVGRSLLNADGTRQCGAELHPDSGFLVKLIPQMPTARTGFPPGPTGAGAGPVGVRSADWLGTRAVGQAGGALFTRDRNRPGSGSAQVHCFVPQTAWPLGKKSIGS